MKRDVCDMKKEWTSPEQGKGGSKARWGLFFSLSLRFIPVLYLQSLIV